jgi:hypothetical protein
MFNSDNRSYNDNRADIVVVTAQSFIPESMFILFKIIVMKLLLQLSGLHLKSLDA